MEAKPNDDDDNRRRRSGVVFVCFGWDDGVRKDPQTDPVHVPRPAMTTQLAILVKSRGRRDA